MVHSQTDSDVVGSQPNRELWHSGGNLHNLMQVPVITVLSAKDLEQLTDQHPVEEVFGNSLYTQTKEMGTYDSLNKAFMGTYNSEIEHFFATLAMRSAVDGAWVGFPIGINTNYMRGVNTLDIHKILIRTELDAQQKKHMENHGGVESRYIAESMKDCELDSNTVLGLMWAYDEGLLTFERKEKGGTEMWYAKPTEKFVAEYLPQRLAKLQAGAQTDPVGPYRDNRFKNLLRRDSI